MSPGSPKIRLPRCFNLSLAVAEKWRRKYLDNSNSLPSMQLWQLVSDKVYRLNAYWTVSSKNPYDCGKMSFAKNKWFCRSPVLYFTNKMMWQRRSSGLSTSEVIGPVSKLVWWLMFFQLPSILDTFVKVEIVSWFESYLSKKFYSSKQYSVI